MNEIMKKSKSIPGPFDYKYQLHWPNPKPKNPIKISHGPRPFYYGES